MLAKQLKVGQKVKFTIAGAINGRTDYEGTIAGTTDGKFVPVASNPSINHTNIYPNLTPAKKLEYADLYTSYVYIQLHMADGTLVYIGEPWIVDSTIVELTSTDLVVKLSNFNTERKSELIKLLTQHDYTVKSVSEDQV